jgi:hypothetical protein
MVAERRRGGDEESHAAGKAPVHGLQHLFETGVTASGASGGGRRRHLVLEKKRGAGQGQHQQPSRHRPP